MSKRVLIIEDDNFLQGLEAKKLSKEGYEVLAASNSEETFKILDSKEKIDMILLDLLLPEVDGFSILQKIRENKELVTLPVIVFSNLSEEKDIDKAKKLGISEFIVKSNFTLDELTEKVRSLIGK
ncbi:MAG: response regulator [Candidatus Pacebacteria bacterium]|nr:response regulator [Candidatus Paceibacterota bacterium]MBP9839856.1 response regulator [Candidatus Paceibacterota bacterium]